MKWISVALFVFLFMTMTFTHFWPDIRPSKGWEDVNSTKMAPTQRSVFYVGLVERRNFLIRHFISTLSVWGNEVRGVLLYYFRNLRFAQLYKFRKSFHIWSYLRQSITEIYSQIVCTSSTCIYVDTDRTVGNQIFTLSIFP